MKHLQLQKLYRLIFKDSDQSVFWLTVFFCVASAAIPSNKIFFVIGTLYVLGLVYITKSIIKAFLYAFLPLSMILLGQVYITTVIPFNELKKSTVGYEGRQFYFRFSPFFVLVLTSIALYAADALRRRGHLNLRVAHIFLLLCVLLRLISAMFTEHYPIYSLTLIIGMAGVVSWLLLMEVTLRELKSVALFRVLKTFFLVILLMTTLQSTITLAQYFKRSTLNLRIEQSTVIPNFGSGADENGLRFRPIGLQTHANELANHSISLLFGGGLLLIWFRRQHKGLPWQLELFFVGQLLAVIVITQSRAAYLAIGLAAVYFFVLQRDVSLQLLHFLQKTLRPFILLFVVASLYFVPLITERVLLTTNSFGQSGGVTTRQALEKLSFELYREKPWFGAGPGMFIPAAFKQSPEGIIAYFPENVHNAFLLYLVESGSFATVAVLAFWYFFIRDVVKSTLDLLTKTCIGAGLIATSVMMLLHPFDNFLTFFVIIAWLIVYIQDNKTYAKPTKHR